jgi:hypothetical protein
LKKKIFLDHISFKNGTALWMPWTIRRGYSLHVGEAWCRNQIEDHFGGASSETTKAYIKFTDALIRTFTMQFGFEVEPRLMVKVMLHFLLESYHLFEPSSNDYVLPTESVLEVLNGMDFNQLKHPRSMEAHEEAIEIMLNMHFDSIGAKNIGWTYVVHSMIYAMSPLFSGTFGDFKDAGIDFGIWSDEGHFLVPYLDDKEWKWELGDYTQFPYEHWFRDDPAPVRLKYPCQVTMMEFGVNSTIPILGMIVRSSVAQISSEAYRSEHRMSTCSLPEYILKRWAMMYNKETIGLKVLEMTKQDYDISMWETGVACMRNIWKDYKLALAGFVGLVATIAFAFAMSETASQPVYETVQGPNRFTVKLDSEKFKQVMSKHSAEEKKKELKRLTGVDMINEKHVYFVEEGVSADNHIDLGTHKSVKTSVEPQKSIVRSQQLSAEPQKSIVRSKQLSVEPQKSVVRSKQLSVDSKIKYFGENVSGADVELKRSGFKGTIVIEAEDVTDLEMMKPNELISKIYQWTEHNSLFVIGSGSDTVHRLFNDSLARLQIDGAFTSSQLHKENLSRSAKLGENIISVKICGPYGDLPAYVLFIEQRTFVCPWHFFQVQKQWTHFEFYLHDSGGPYICGRDTLKITHFDDGRDLTRVDILVPQFAPRKSIFKRLPENIYSVQRSDLVCRIWRFTEGDHTFLHTITNETPCLLTHGRVFNGTYKSLDENRDITYSITSYYTLHNAPTEHGDCSIPVQNLDVHAHLRDVIGIVTGKSQQSCIITPICQADFPDFKEARELITTVDVGEFVASPYEEFTSKDGKISERVYAFPVIPGTRTLFHNSKLRIQPSEKSTFVRSPIIGDLEEFLKKHWGEFYMDSIPVAPTALTRNAQKNAFARLALNSGCPLVNRKVRRLLENPIVYKGFGPKLKGRSLHIRTLEQALFANGGLHGMPVSKSATTDLKIDKYDRKDMWGEDVYEDRMKGGAKPKLEWIVVMCPEADGKRWINPIFRKLITEHVEKIESGNFQYQGFAEACLKDELTTVEKSQNEKTRLFMVSSLVLAVLCKMLLGDLMGFHADLIDNPIKIGVNAHARDWEFIQDVLLTHENLLGGDYSGWDYSVLFLFVTPWLSYLKSLPWLNFAQAVLWIMALGPSIVGYIMVYMDRLVERLQGVSSGHYWTSLFNSFVNYVMFSIAFYCLVPEEFYDMKDSLYVMIFYGDDNGGSVSSRIAEYFNLETIAKFFKEQFNMTLTDPEKKDIKTLFLNITTFKFLSRRFVQTPEGAVKAPLDAEAIVGMLAYIRKPTDKTIAEQLDQNIETAMRELVMYDRKYYESFENFFNSVRHKFGGKFVIKPYDLAEYHWIQDYHSV